MRVDAQAADGMVLVRLADGRVVRLDEMSEVVRTGVGSG
jgi:hypothetical protein